MSFVTDVLKKKSGTTKETIISSLLNDDDLETKTRLHDPMAMTAFDVLALHLSTPAEQRKILGMPTFMPDPTDKTKQIANRQPIRLGDYLRYAQTQARKNLISEDGGSRNEAVQALNGVETKQEQEHSLQAGFFT